MSTITSVIAIFFFSFSSIVQQYADYTQYHKQTNTINEQIANEDYAKALDGYEALFQSYDFIFLKDYKIASQLAAITGQKDRVFYYLREGIKSGWTWKNIKKHSVFKTLRTDPKWREIKAEYEKLHNTYEKQLDQSLRYQVHEMFKKDQSLALGVLFRIRKQSRQKYLTTKFAPHSVDQLSKIIQILSQKDYPGERLIGNNFWASTIISHHNSITTDLTRKDTLFNYIQPMLLNNIKRGYLSPAEYAVMHDWRIAALDEKDKIGYGFLNSVKSSSLNKTDHLRQSIGLPSISLRNRLVAIEKQTEMKLYLTDWIKGEIAIEGD